MLHCIHFYCNTPCVVIVQYDILGVLGDESSVWATLSKHPADDKAPASSSNLFLDRNTFSFYWCKVYMCTHLQTQRRTHRYSWTQLDRGAGPVWLALPAGQLTLQVVRVAICFM